MMKLSYRNTIHAVRDCSRWILTVFAFAILSASHAEDSHDHQDESGHTDTHDEHAGHGEHEGPVTLDARDVEDFGIQIAEAGPGMIREELRLPGEVHMNESTTAHVRPRYDGVVTRINHRLGDVVESGDVLATMESTGTLRPFDLRSPLDGTIVAQHITPGENLGTGEVAYVVADTRTIWIDLRVYQRDLPKVHVGQEVHISAGHDYPEAEGAISYVGPVVDESSRTGLIRAVLPNPEGLYRPGLFVIGHVLLDEHRVAVLVPRTAVHTMDGQSIVFVQDEHGYEPSIVRIGRSDTGNVEITRGLEPGQRYVAEGGFFLKADSQKENFGDGHAH